MNITLHRYFQRENNIFLEEADVRTAHTLSSAAQFHPGRCFVRLTGFAAMITGYSCTRGAEPAELRGW